MKRLAGAVPPLMAALLGGCALFPSRGPIALNVVALAAEPRTQRFRDGWMKWDKPCPEETNLVSFPDLLAAP